MKAPVEVEVGNGIVRWTLYAAAAGLALIASDHRRTPYDGAFDAAGAEYGIDANLLRALARRESKFDPNAIGDKGTSFGLGQLHLPTIRSLGLDLARIMDPLYNARGMALLLGKLRQELGPRWSPDAWVASYNAGSPNVLKHGLAAAVPGYVEDVTFHWRLYGLGRIVA